MIHNSPNKGNAVDFHQLSVEVLDLSMEGLIKMC